MRRLRVLMASAEELVEPIFRNAIEEGGLHLATLNLTSYRFPMSGKHILKAVEDVAGLLE